MPWAHPHDNLQGQQWWRVGPAGPSRSATPASLDSWVNGKSTSRSCFGASLSEEGGAWRWGPPSLTNPESQKSPTHQDGQLMQNPQGEHNPRQPNSQ